jgi:hypothetical protein
MPALFIDDAYTASQTIPARPGFHPAVEVVYRPALAKVRHEYAAACKGSDPAKIDAFEADLVSRHIVTLNDSSIDKAKAGKLHPLVRADLVDLILSFAPGSVPVEADAPN